MKLICVREIDDYASRCRLGDIVHVDRDILKEDIVNIRGGHYLIKELFQYFVRLDKPKKTKLGRILYK